MATPIEVQVRQRIEREVRADPSYRRQSMPGFADVPPEFIAGRKAFAARWEAIIAEGEKANYLEWTNDYAGSHLEITDHMQVPVGPEWTETETELEARIQTEIARRWKNWATDQIGGTR